MHDKKYLVKIYRQGAFAGVLPYPVDDVEYSQDINTAGCEITVKLGTDLKSAGISVDVDYLVTNTGAHITDQNGNRLITRKDYMFNSVPVDIGNQADIWLYYGDVSTGAPNGIRIFSGLITSWEEDEDDATITMTALSYGVQLDNYPIEVLPNSTLVEYNNANTFDFLYAAQKTATYNRTVILAQTFQVGASTTTNSIKMLLAKPVDVPNVTVIMTLFSGVPTGTQVLLGTASRVVSDSTAAMLAFTFPTPVALTTGVTYSIMLTHNSSIDNTIIVGRDTAGTYSGGQAYSYNDTTGVWSNPGGDYSFSVNSSSGAIGNQFLSVDPSTILTKLLDTFNNSGGVVSYSGTSIGITGTAVSYKFGTNTVLDGIKKCLQLAPPNWYWYVDIGSNTLYFKRFNLTPNHTFVKGQHINKLKVKYTLEQINNKFIFTGGDNPSNPGTNIVSKQINSGSIAKYGQWLGTDSDSRVTLQSTADLIANNKLGEKARPQFSTKCTVLAARYDIETLQIGQMVGFQNFNDLTNSLILQIVSISRKPDKAQLTLATLPPSQTHRIEDIKRNLDELVTANNPAP